ncbi:hydrogenase maturation protease [Stanieria sp. NIES-3757]|nr:hydrogenase maturation protease [Stanieria sp. NIES-3757]
MKCLIIGYGNTLRSDDGAGQLVAEEVANWNLKNLRVISTHQLTPELAADIAETELVIFVDAYLASASPKIKTYCLEPLANPSKIESHISNPRVLLTLAQTLYNYCPQAWLITVPGENFDLGDCLSPLTQHGITEAVKKIESLLTTIK